MLHQLKEIDRDFDRGCRVRKPQITKSISMCTYNVGTSSLILAYVSYFGVVPQFSLRFHSVWLGFVLWVGVVRINYYFL